MFKVIGKAHYSVTYEGQVYPKIRYTLEMDSMPKGYTDSEGTLCEVVCVKYSDFNNKAAIGDNVQVSYNRYGKPDLIIVI